MSGTDYNYDEQVRARRQRHERPSLTHCIGPVLPVLHPDYDHAGHNSYHDILFEAKQRCACLSSRVATLEADTRTELENTGTRIESDFVPEHADLIQGQRKKQKRLERRLKRGLLMVLGWSLIAGMVYLIIVTARIVPKIWNPYDVLGIDSVRLRIPIETHEIS